MVHHDDRCMSGEGGEGVQMDVFLGSSNTLRDLRLAFSELIDSLADAAFDRCGQELTGRLWETESYAMERARSKQEAYDEVIRGCELAFFLVDGTLGDYTLHEFEVALEAPAPAEAVRVVVWLRPEEHVGAYDANTRRLLELASGRPDVRVLPLASEGELLLDMTELVCSRLPQLAPELRAGGVWVGHRRLVDTTGLPDQVLHAFAAALERTSMREGVA